MQYILGLNRLIRFRGFLFFWPNMTELFPQRYENLSLRAENFSLRAENLSVQLVRTSAFPDFFRLCEQIHAATRSGGLALMGDFSALKSFSWVLKSFSWALKRFLPALQRNLRALQQLFHASEIAVGWEVAMGKCLIECTLRAKILELYVRWCGNWDELPMDSVDHLLVFVLGICKNHCKRCGLSFFCLTFARYRHRCACAMYAAAAPSRLGQVYEHRKPLAAPPPYTKGGSYQLACDGFTAIVP